MLARANSARGLSDESTESARQKVLNESVDTPSWPGRSVEV